MTPTRFAALASSYGHDIGRWPDADQAAARAHLLVSADAAALLRAEAPLDIALGAWHVSGPGAALAGKIAVDALRRQASFRRFRLWLSSAGAAAVLASGVAAGAALVAFSADMSDPTGHLDGLTVLGAPLDLDAASGPGAAL